MASGGGRAQRQAPGGTPGTWAEGLALRGPISSSTLRSVQRLAGNHATQHLVAIANGLVVQRDWNPDKCQGDATRKIPDIEPGDVVNLASGKRPAFVSGATQKNPTKSWKYTFYATYAARPAGFPPGWTIALVAHTHVDRKSGTKVPGNMFIPGYEGWEKETDATFVNEAPDYDNTVHVDGWCNKPTIRAMFYEGMNRYPTYTPPKA